MRFNSSSTIFFRQARAIHELAKRVFHVLKTDATKIEYEFPLTRERTGRKPPGETAGLHSKPAPRRRGNNKVCCRSPSSNPRDSGILLRSRNGRNVNLCRTDRHQTYKLSASDSIVSAVYNSSKQLLPENGGIDYSIDYKESLLRFVKDLGPTAQMVAYRKLSSLTQKTPNFSVQDSSNLVSLPSTKQGPIHVDGVINNITAHENNPIRSNDAVLKGKNVLTSDSIGVKDSASLGKMVFGIGNLDIHGASKGKSVLTDNNTDSSNGASGGRTMGFQRAFQKQMFPCGETMVIPSVLQGFHVKAVDRGLNGPFSGMIPPSDKLDLTQAVKDDNSQQSWNAKTWLSLELPNAGSEVLNANGIPGICGKYKMDQHARTSSGDDAHHSHSTQNQLPLHFPGTGASNINAGTTNTHNEYQTIDAMVGSGLQSHGSNRHAKSTFYPSIDVKPSGSDQESTFVPGLMHHSVGRMKESSAPLDLKYLSSVSQVNQPLAIFDFPYIKQQHSELNLLGEGGLVKKVLQPRAGQYLQPVPCEVNALGQGAFWEPTGATPLDQEMQLGLARNVLQQQPNEVNLSGKAACPRQGFPTACMQQQPSLLNLLMQDVFVQPEPLLPAVPYFQTHHDGVNPLGPNMCMQQGLQLGPSQYRQPMPGDVNLSELSPRGQMFDAGSINERGPLQNQQWSRHEL